MIKSKFVKFRILIKQNILALAILILWFTGNYLVFYKMTGFDAEKALLYTFYFAEMKGAWGHFYPMISSIIIFGWVFTLITIELYRKYNPVQTCLQLSKSMKNHIVIIGYSHLGQRIREYLVGKKKPYVVVEDDKKLISELIEKEEPVVPLKACDPEMLKYAAIENAKLVMITRNDLEAQVVAVKYVKELNPDCRIICRVFDDSMADIIEKNLGCETISSSRYTAELIYNQLKSLNTKEVLLAGCTNTTRRLINMLKKDGISIKAIEKKEESLEGMLDAGSIIIGNARDRDVLIRAGIKNIDKVIVFIDNAEDVLHIADKIRELNPNCQLICRFFHEQVAEILEKPPFNATVVSTSKHALKKIIESDIFENL
jgi:Trk K+ transport system NAD-binding subunit